MKNIIIDIAMINLFLGMFFTFFGYYRRKIMTPPMLKEAFLPLGLGFLGIYISIWFLYDSFDTNILLKTSLKTHQKIKILQSQWRFFSSIFFISSLVCFYISSRYNDAILKQVHIFLKWISKKTIPSIVTTIIVAWLCHRLGFNPPEVGIASLTIGGFTFALNVGLSKTA
jgi:hypothetical protein